MKKLLLSVLISVLTTTGTFAMSFDTPAGELNIYGSVRSYIFYTDISGSDTYRDLTSVKMGLQGNSRTGIQWKQDNIFVHFELGLGGTAHDTAGLRLLYADYTFENGMGKFRAGQFATISDTTAIFSRKADNDASLFGFGAVAQIRRPGIMYTVKGFSIALTTMAGNDSGNFTGLYASTYTDVRFRELLPKIEIDYQLPISLPVRVFGAYALVNADAIDNSTGTNSKKNLDATGFHIGAAVSPVIDSFYAHITGFYAVNGGLYSMIKTGNGSGGLANVLPVLNANNKIKNTDTTGVAVAVGYKLSPLMTAEVGGGYQISNNTLYNKADCNRGFYANLTYKPNKWVMITPEIGYLDYMKTFSGKDDAKVIQIGGQYRMDF